MNKVLSVRWHGPIALFPIDALHPTEEHCEDRVQEVMKSISSSGDWTRLIAVEKHFRIVMDGHHRLEAARRLGFDFVPCAALTYSEVRVESRRPNLAVSDKEIIRRGLNKDLYPIKSTRHIFPVSFVLDCQLPIKLLKA